MSDVVVSICCITYNHERFIRDALNGFVMQITDFPFEVIIHDDASTDGTADVIREYEMKYPDLIFPIYQVENQYSKGIRGISARFNFPRARGKYIALCEGDDYWTDPLKLQKQVDFLRNNNSNTMCFHAVQVMNAVNGKLLHTHRAYKHTRHVCNMRDIILGGGGFYKIVSAMFVKDALDNLPEWYFLSPVGDAALILVAATRGDIGYLDEVMAVYRARAQGSWSERKAHSSIQTNFEQLMKLAEFRRSFDRATEYKYTSWVQLRNSHNYMQFLSRQVVNKKSRTELYKNVRHEMTATDRALFHLRSFLGYASWLELLVNLKTSVVRHSLRH